MKLDRFVEERRPGWTGLEALLRDAGAKPERLGPERLRRLGGLYRAAAADLAFARRAFPHDPVTRRLERLVARRRARPSTPTRARGARCGGSSRPATGAACWSGRGRSPPRWCCCSRRSRSPRCGRSTIPPRRSAWCRPQFQGAAEPGGGPGALSAGDQAALSSEIFTNNIRVTFLAIAGGIFAGLGTAAVLIFNGGFIGAILGLTIENGSSAGFVELVVPHGVLELSCIAVAAAAGLRIGWALVEPGTLTRGQSLRREARPAMELVLGTMPWLVLAGLVEGFVTGSTGGLGGAIVVGVGLGVVFWGLVAWRGRRSSEPGAGLGLRGRRARRRRGARPRAPRGRVAPARSSPCATRARAARTSSATAWP